MTRSASNMDRKSAVDRRHFFASSAAALAAAGVGAATPSQAQETPTATPIVTPPEGKRILLSCKLTMISEQKENEPLADRLRRAAKAGFDGVDLDEAGRFTPEQARDAVAASGVFVHNAINHDHWKYPLTSPQDDVRATERANIEHCIRVSHAAGGNGVLLVVGVGSDGPEEEIAERCRKEIQQLLPMAAAMGQMILVENVWNRMFYDHDAPPDQSADRFVQFIDSFNSPWVGMYYDLGNHWKYGQPGDWLRQFGRRAVKLDVKGFSRAHDKFTDIGEGDLPWDQVRQAIEEVGFTGWVTAEVGGGDVQRLTLVRQQMQRAFGL